MKNKGLKRSFTALLIMLSLLFLASQGFAGEKEGLCERIDIDFMHQHLNLPKQVEIASSTPVNNLCQVILNINGRYFTTYASDKYVIIGKMYEDHTLLDNSELARLQKLSFIKAKPELDKCIAIDYKPKSSTKSTIYMITDPMCPYCNMATKKVKEFADNYNAELKIVFFGVHGTTSDQKAIEAVCRNFTLPEYAIEGWEKGDSKKYQCQEGKDLIERSKSAVRNLHVQGVPTFFLQDGTQVVGADVARLKKAIGR